MKMLIMSSFVLLVVFCSGFVEAFFLFEKHKPILFCIKVCPLYCSPQRRYDEDVSSLDYADDRSYYPYYEDFPPTYYRYFKPLPKPTTPKPTTTAPTTAEPITEPYFYPDDHWLWLNRFCKPSPKPTTEKPKPTESWLFYPNYFDDYESQHFLHWKPKPTPTTTEKTTTEMTTTTEEPTWICMVCKKKCGYPPS